MYWSKKNGSTRYPEKLISLIAKRIEIILKNPESFKSTEFPDTRESAMGHLSIFFKLTDVQLIITSFWDNRQDPKKLIE